MQDIFIEFLPPWVETNLQPAFYDAESGTVLQQTARMYAKVNELVASVNNMDKVIKQYIDYIDNYFENLDVQDEIDHKLDEMAEGGELAEYIAQYANLPCVHAYATIADMASSENLVDGSYARAMSKTVAGTGDGFYYKIRDIEEGDDPDGENLVAIGDDLVAEKIPDANLTALGNTLEAEIATKLPHFIVASGASADDVQALIDIEGEKIIEFEKGVTFTFTKALHLTSGTILELNGATLHFNFIDATDETLGIYNYKFDDTFTGYNGAQNVAIKNGYIKQGCVVLMHGNNTLLENVEFINMYCRHCIQIAGCKDTTIKNCTFNGVYKDDTIGEGSECINIDPTYYGAQPYMPEESVMYDDTDNYGIYIYSCKFNNPTDEYHKYYIAVGAHSAYGNYRKYSHLIKIENCIFGTPNYWAICINSMDFVSIRNNELLGNSAYSRDDGTYFIITRNSNDNIEVMCNVVKGINQFYHSGATYITNNHITLQDNIIETVDNAYLKEPVVMVCCNYTIIDRNTIYSEYGGIRYWGDPNASNIASDIKIVNNNIKSSADSDVIRLEKANNIIVDGNILASPPTATHTLLYLLNLTNILSVANNKITNKQRLTGVSTINDKFINNGALYTIVPFGTGSTSMSGTLDGNASKFRKLVLLLGDGTNTQTVDIQPWYYNGNNIDDRTYKFAVVNGSNQVEYGSLVISNSGANYAYTGPINLRCVWGSDT